MIEQQKIKNFKGFIEDQIERIDSNLEKLPVGSRSSIIQSGTRLGYAVCLEHFLEAFGDTNSDSTDEIDKIINKHGAIEILKRIPGEIFNAYQDFYS